MSKHRVIPTVLTDGVSQVKGTGFDNWRTVGSVVQAIKLYSSRDVDELVLLDVTARKNGATLSLDLVRQVSRYLRIPFAVGGGIRSVRDIEELLRAGADKAILGTDAFASQGLISEAANRFGSQALVCAVDIVGPGDPFVAVRSGTEKLEIGLEQAVKFAQEQGIGEVLLQSVALDGARTGYDLDSIRAATRFATVPVIAGSGAGCYEDFEAAIDAGADAVAAGAMFQFSELTPAGAREFLRNAGFNVRR